MKFFRQKVSKFQVLRLIIRMCSDCCKFSKLKRQIADKSLGDTALLYETPKKGEWRVPVDRRTKDRARRESAAGLCSAGPSALFRSGQPKRRIALASAAANADMRDSAERLAAASSRCYTLTNHVQSTKNNKNRSVLAA